MAGWRGALLIAALALAGCGGATGGTIPTTSNGATATASALPAASPSASSRAQLTDGCTLLTKAEASTAMGVDAGAAIESSPISCAYAVGTNASGGANQTVSIRLAPAASMPLAQLRGQLQGAEGYREVTGVGDVAFLAAHGGGGQLYFTKGSMGAVITLSFGGSGSVTDAALADKLVILGKNAAGRL